MSDNIDPNQEYLSFGFCKKAQKEFNIIIPTIIIKIINKYQIEYKILAIGYTRSG